MKANHYDNISCLYVEDDRDARETLGAILSRIFARVFVASDGKAGLDLFLRNQPDLVITDILMPVMNGLQMIKHIFETQPDTRVIVTTAHSETQFLIEAIEMGVDHYVLKPIELEKLYRAIDKSVEVIQVNQALKDEQSKKDALIHKLSVALDEIKTLQGILPICSCCKKIRNDEGYYEKIEAYMARNLDIHFSHTICTDCMKRYYPEEYAYIKANEGDKK